MAKADSHTAAIFFHGVGDPRRSVSLGDLLDHLDLYGQRHQETGLGTLRAFRYRKEFSQSNNLLDYVECSQIKKSRSKPYVARTIRFYEAYWAPVTNAKYGFFYICLWMIKRIVISISLLFSNWRAFPALRLSTLCYMSEKHEDIQNLPELERLYRDFESWEGRSSFPRGRFEDFRSFIRKKAEADNTAALERTLKVWKASFLKFTVSTTLKALLQILLVPMLAYLVWNAFGIVRSEPGGMRYWIALVEVMAIPLFSMVVWQLMRAHVIDVLTWTIDSERGERAASRHAIIDYCRTMLRDVASNPSCKEVVVIAHSLGSAIAMESILQEGDRIKGIKLMSDESSVGDHWIKKVKTVFLLGSPIDRIFQFFQVDTTFSHRFNRLHEERRLSLSLPPFRDIAFAGQSTVINFWSRFDPISSQVHSLRKSVQEPKEALINSEAVPVGMPWAIPAHTSYFSDPLISGSIYRALVLGGGQFKPNASLRATNFVKLAAIASFPLPFAFCWLLAAPLFGWAAWVPLVTVFANLSLILWLSGRAKHWHQDKLGSYLQRNS